MSACVTPLVAPPPRSVPRGVSPPTPERLRDRYTTGISLVVLGAMLAAGPVAWFGATQLDVAGQPALTTSWINLLLLCAATVLAVTLTATWALADRFARPFQELAETLRQDLPFDEPTGEYETIATGIQQMQTRLHDAEDSLRRHERLAEMGQFAAALGHELRGPMTVIRGRAELLQMRLDDPARAASLADRLQHDIDLMVELLENLVVYARVRESDPVAVDLAALCTDLLSDMTLPPTIVWAVRAEPFSPDAWVDETQLRSVASNLIRNAIEAMPEGGLVEVRVAPSGEHGVRLEVRDQGVGMPPDVQAHLFEPLFTTKTTGTGLGMGIVKNFVQTNGGRVLVESVEGRGTTMTVELPADARVAGRWRSTAQ